MVFSRIIPWAQAPKEKLTTYEAYPRRAEIRIKGPKVQDAKAFTSPTAKPEISEDAERDEEDAALVPQEAASQIQVIGAESKPFGLR